MKNEPNYANRIKEVRKSLAQDNIDALLIDRWENYFYLTGFMEEEAYCLVTGNHIYLLVDSRYIQQAACDCVHCTVIEYGNDAEDILLDCMQTDGAAVLALDRSYITYARYMQYKQSFQSVELAWSDGGIPDIRICKDHYETEQVVKAQEITDYAFHHVLPLIKCGVSEIEIAAELEYIMKKQGGMKPSFDTIVVSGRRTSLPHGKPTNKKIEYGDAVTMDFGCILNGYCSDMTRTVFVGKVSEQLKEIYQTVIASQEAAIKIAKKGVSTAEVDRAARDIIAEKGYEKYFVHGTGHGIGIEIHEAPRVSSRGNETVLRNGMIITIEPGIYLPGIGGVRVEDDIVINGGDPVNITKSDKKMLII